MAIDLGNTPTGTPPTAGEKLQIRSAIGVGTTDSPTFLAQTLTGQSLTGTQATSLVDLSATWNTSGTPSAIKLNVTETGAGSNAASKLIDLRLSNLDRFVVKKDGTTTIGGTDVGSQIQMLNLQNQYGNVGFLVGGGGRVGLFSGYEYASFFPSGVLTLNGASSYLGIGPNLAIHRDGADGILAQRNGTAAQQFRVYNSFTGVTGDNDWGVFGFASAGANLKIGTQKLNSGGSRAVEITSTAGIYFNPASSGLTWQFGASGHLTALSDNTYDIGASGARPRTIYAGTNAFFGALGLNAWWSTSKVIQVGHAALFNSGLSVSTALSLSSNLCETGGGPLYIATGFSAKYDQTAGDHAWLTAPSGAASAAITYTERFRITNGGLLTLGGTTSAFPAIKRNGTGIDIVLANDSGFAPVKGKITTDTAYTAGASAATGFITIFDSTGTAYRVWCTPA